MVQGVLNSDLINTVSPSYAREIATSQYGAGLEKVIRKRRQDLYGILNGIDVKAFDPSRDIYIKEKYSIRSIHKKRLNKLALQKAFGLPLNENMPVCGLVSRLVWQKGLDLFGDSFHRLKCQFVFLGTGQKEYEDYLQRLAYKYPEQFAVKTVFDLKLAQMIYAGADIFLMPSRYEPCGLGQMIAMRYGAVPVVRATGGLKDTVSPKLGFTFKDISKTEHFQAIQAALEEYYRDPREWQSRQLRCMQQDFSWTKSAQEYLKLYKKLI
jgi:starch synthase